MRGSRARTRRFALSISVGDIRHEQAHEAHHPGLVVSEQPVRPEVMHVPGFKPGWGAVMTGPDACRLLLLAAIWGASFVWMRVAVPEFGPWALTAIRAAGGALVLVPLVGWQPIRRALSVHPLALLAVGVFGIALPYASLSFASQQVPAAVTSLINATTPIFAALVGMFWLGQATSRGRWLGFLVAFFGVALVVTSKGGVSGASALDPWRLAACVIAAASYGMAANLMRRYLSETNPVVVAACTQMGASFLLLAPAGSTWPGVSPGTSAWFAAVMLAVLCTGFANAIYFRLVQRAGASSATSVTFLIPAFAATWAHLFLGEAITVELALGGALILGGCALATGLLKMRPVLGLIHRRLRERQDTGV